MNMVATGSFQLIDSWKFCGISGSYYPANVSYVQPVDDYLLKDVEILICKHCKQAHRVDYRKLQAISVLSCQKCGASLL